MARASASAGGVLGGRDQVDVLAGLGPAPGRAGDLDPVRGRELAQVAADLLGDRQHLGEQQPLAEAVLGHALERGEDVLLDLRPEAPHRADPALLGRLLQLVEVLDAELVVEPPGGLRAEARAPGSPRPGSPGTSPSASPPRGSAGLEQGVDLLRQRLADAGELGRPPLRGELLDRDRALADGAGGLPVGEHPVSTAPSSS